MKQVELCRAEASQRVTQNLPTIVEGLRAKKKKEIDDRRATGEDVSDSELENIKFDADNIEIPPLPEKHSSCVHPGQFDEANWNFPLSPEEILHYRVYRDLYDKGYWLTSGGKFGGDFLVYPAVMLSLGYSCDGC
ncbi:hypothetical protein LSH36_95g04074 [Paralvinella palmiformis]|uniref:tRNA-intron lyase n=1 Tax=Paralvinella palmiformis TaxID=53620 RepID=A0AAD9NBL6_9ANNE|nr:hypothetical protein LSH36_95g04074 [Paralvinella palmiformis]